MSKSNKSVIPHKPRINKARLATKMSNFVEYGRQEISSPNIKTKIEKYPIGSMISYTNKMDIFREGGFITKFANDYFIYVTPDFKTKYRVKYKNITKVWIGDVYKTKNDLVSIVKSTQEKTKFPVKLGETIIFYALTNYDAKRFKHTKKYQLMCSWYDYFNKNN